MEFLQQVLVLTTCALVEGGGVCIKLLRLKHPVTTKAKISNSLVIAGFVCNQFLGPVKVDREKHTVIVDQILDDISIPELVDELPDHQPRFVVLSYRMSHADGRVSYPLCFIYITPRDTNPELCMMYAGTKLHLQKELNLTRVYELRELEELTEEWLQSKIK